MNTRLSVIFAGSFVLILSAIFGPPPVLAAPATTHSASTSKANQNPDELARAAADRFAHAIDHADAAAAAYECSLPFLNQFNEMAEDTAKLKKSMEYFTEFARRNPQAGALYRGVDAAVAFDAFHERLKAVAKAPQAQHQSLDNIDKLKLAAMDRVVLVRWMYAYSMLVRVRDGKATIAGLGPTLPADEITKKLIAQNKPYKQVRDVVYGRTNGAALTMDVLTPTGSANGAVVIDILSGDFASKPMPEADQWVVQPLLTRGYTVVTVVHGCIPKYTIAEILRHAYRAVRFIRFHARDYGIDPQRIGVMGSSSGGYLALMLATDGDHEPGLVDASDLLGAPDEIDAVSCNVKAAGCYFPPSDWMNYGGSGKCILDVSWGPQVTGIFALREFDMKQFDFVTVKDRAKLERWLAEISPANRITKSSAPTFILHGEKDPTVPLQQSQVFIERLKTAGVAAELEVKPGAEHGWPNESRDLDQIVNWFDKYLKHRP